MARLPELFDRDQLPEAARQAYDYIAKSRGRVSNSYASMLHAPEVAERIAHLGTYLRFESSLDDLTVELIALTTSSELDNPYEGAIHAPTAARLGVDAEVIAAIRAKNPLPGTAPEIAMPVSCARELVRTRALPDALFEAAHRAFGHQGVVDLIGAVGFYAMLAYVHNGLQVRLPQG